MTQIQPPRIAATGLRGLVGSGVRKTTAQDLHWHDLGVDITDLDAVRDALDHTSVIAVINFAAFTNTDKAWEERGNQQGACYRTNVIGPRNLARACAERDRYLIHVSTDYVYRGDRNSPYREEDPTGPIEWYGQTKCWGETEVLNNNPNAAVFRIASPFQATSHPRSEDIVYKIVRLLQSGTLPPMFEDTVITPTFIDDFARAIARAVVVRPNGIFNVVGTTALSPAQLAREVASVYRLDAARIQTGRLAEYLTTNNRPYAQYLHLSNEKVEQALGVTFSTVSAALMETRRQQQEALGR